MSRVKVEYFLAVDECGNTAIDETPTDAVGLLAQRYETACARLVQLSLSIPLPPIEHAVVDIPEPNDTVKIAVADAV